MTAALLFDSDMHTKIENQGKIATAIREFRRFH